MAQTQTLPSQSVIAVLPWQVAEMTSHGVAVIARFAEQFAADQFAATIGPGAVVIDRRERTPARVLRRDPRVTVELMERDQ